MINREMRKVTIKSNSGEKNSYGQKLGFDNPRVIDMVVKVYRQTNISDIRYNDITNIGLTYEVGITDKDQIIIDNKTYNVIYVIPSGKLHQIFMKKV